jgi:putative protease
MNMERAAAGEGKERSLPELLLPAGSFDSAIAAFEGGADAVYLGFRDFSARRQARNFDREEYRRLLAFARSRDKRLYVTLNTVIAEAEMAAAADLLVFLARFRPDAVIFQDWGIASLVRDRFPELPLHASTQAAIQTPEAARLAAENGATRVVLPRECGLEDLRRFSREAPGLEFEVFVHGALCFSWSGLCLASGLLLGRSGNRGECAQVCRSWYLRGERKEAGYWFSCRDLNLVDELGALRDAGAASLKVEGRMKSPEYVFAVARLYRAALDALDAPARRPSDKDHLDELADAARVAFSRAPTRAYFADPGGESIIDSAWPGHRGAAAGRVKSSAEGRAVIELGSPLGLRDGVMVEAASGSRSGLEGGKPAEPLAFAVLELRDARTGRPLTAARAGGLVEMAAPARLPVGVEIRRISAREADRRAVAKEEYPPALEEIAARVSVEEGDGNARLAFEFERPRWMLPVPGRDAATADGSGYRMPAEEPLILQEAKNPGGFGRFLALLSESGESELRIRAAFDERPALLNGRAVPLADLFAPPSALKRVKNRLYERLQDWIEKEAGLRAGLAAASSPSAELLASRFGGRSLLAGQALPGRAKLCPPSDLLQDGLPFVTPRFLREGTALPNWAGCLWMPLAPLVADWEAYRLLVKERVRGELAAGNRILVGIDALHHVPLARDLDAIAIGYADGCADGGPDAVRLGFFGDIHLYLANLRSIETWARLVPGMAFAYSWIEAESPTVETAGDFLREVGEGFAAPLFLSRACHLRHTRNGGTCPAGCSRRFTEILTDRDRRYRVVVDDCVTMLFRV